LESIAFEGHFDPHIWFDVTLWKRVANEITRALSDYDPEHKDILDHWYNCNAYRLQLEEVLLGHIEDGTDTTAKRDEIKYKAFQLAKLADRLEDCMN